MQNNFLQAVLDYTDRGFSIIPIKPHVDEENKKKPFIKWHEFQNRRAVYE